MNKTSGGKEMGNAALFENTTLVHEKATADLTEIFGKKKKKWDKEILFVLTFIVTAASVIGLMAFAGMFDETIPGTIATRIHIGGFPLAAALFASAAVSLGVTVLYAIRNREPRLTAEELSKSVRYRYIISDEGITVEHAYRKDKIAFEDIEKITCNGYSYFIYAKENRYQISRNGFGSKITAFERFMEGQGFTIGIEP